tara:strand:- start:213 stop:893 length:681 start_codon:yes stop_codon:yes gene_type:complete
LRNAVVALIPARSGSKGIKDKNIKKLRGIPLIGWAIKSCKKSKLIGKIVVSTDSNEYSKIAYKFGADQVIIRPKSISKDSSSDFEFIDHAINKINFNFDLIAHIRPTTPLRKKGLIDKAIKIFNKEKIHALRSVHEMSESSYKSFEVVGKNIKPLKFINSSLEKLNNPRQKFPKTYAGNGIVDIYKKNFILKNKKLYGKKVRAFITPYAFEVDNLDDFKILQKIIK